MSKDYSIIQADHKNDWDGKFGPMRSYALKLEELPVGSGIVHEVEMNQKSTTSAPAAGETVSGGITPNSNPDFPPKFKKEFKGNSGSWSPKSAGGFKPRDPAEIAGARHAHSLLVAAHSFEPIPINTTTPERIQERIDNLEAFAQVLDEKTKAASDQAVGNPHKAKDDDLPF